MRLTHNVLAFANKSNDNKAFIECFKEYMDKHNGKAIPTDSKLNFMSNTQADEAMNAELIKAIETFSGYKRENALNVVSWSTNPAVQHAMYAIVGTLVDAVMPDTMLDTIGLYSEIRYGGFGDSFQFDLKPRDLLSVSQSSNGKRKSFIMEQHGTTYTLAPTPRQITVGVSLYDVLSGKSSLAFLVMKAIRSIETQLTYDTYDTMAAGLEALPNGAGTLRLDAYTQDSAVQLAQQVTAWNNGQKAVFVGTQLALGKILPTNDNYRYLLDSDYVKLGYVKEFNGFSTMVLPQVADYTSDSFGLKLPNNRIYVISPSSDKLVKVAIEGETLSFVDKPDGHANLVQAATFTKRWDVGFITASVAGVITIA